ncbi:hypothetical protein HZ326_16538 [Fusarium oxysporum f. sp. albedinis]|nr:hypothetical protein HZ326_16538 [Fusarium oxysporum f. sp. albedinis]
MCTKTLIEHKCGHRVLRGNTRCYREDCPGRKEDITKVDDECAQCENKPGRFKSSRWCSVGCCTDVHLFSIADFKELLSQLTSGLEETGWN